MGMWMMEEVDVVPRWFRTATVLFTAVEISTGLFDFAVSAKGFYPDANGAPLPWYCWVEHILVPGGVYNRLGTWAWLVNTILPIVYCIKADLLLYLSPAAYDLLIYFLLPPAFLYAWHECSQFIFIISTWVEVEIETPAKAPIRDRSPANPKRRNMAAPASLI